MGIVLLLVMYVAALFVLVVQPVRILWGIYIALIPPKGRYLNRSVLGISLFIKVLSLLMAGYLAQHFGSGFQSLFETHVLKFMVLPFIIYVMSELVARFVYRQSSDKI